DRLGRRKVLLSVCSSLRRHRDGAVSPAPLVSSLPLAPCRVWALRCSFLAVCRLSARRFQRANVVEQSERGPGPPLSQYRGRTVSSLNDACQCLSMPVLSHQRLNDEQSQSGCAPVVIEQTADAPSCFRRTRFSSIR